MLSSVDWIGVFIEDTPKHLLRLLPDVRCLELDFSRSVSSSFGCHLFALTSSSFADDWDDHTVHSESSALSSPAQAEEERQVRTSTR